MPKKRTRLKIIIKVNKKESMSKNKYKIGQTKKNKINMDGFMQDKYFSYSPTIILKLMYSLKMGIKMFQKLYGTIAVLFLMKYLLSILQKKTIHQK